MIFAIISSLATYELSKIEKVGAIRSSSLIGIGIFSMSVYFPVLDASHLFGATFVGMCSSSRLNRKELVLATMIYSLSLTFLSGYFIGFGGLLGMSSFIGVISTFLLSFTHKKILKKLQCS